MVNRKNIKGYEGFYMVSTNGEIISNKNGVLKAWVDTNGYKKVKLCRNGERKNAYVHRIVAQHFIDNPGNLSHVNHIDAVKTNNTIDNLEWVTPIDNHRHASNLGLMKNPPRNVGEKHPMSKLKEHDVISIREDYANGAKQVDLAKKYNMPQGSISNIIRRKTWFYI